MGDAVFAAEVIKSGAPGRAVLRLEGTRPIIEAGMDDAAVVPGLVGRQAGFLFEDDDAQPWMGLGQGEGRRAADDATADDGKVVNVRGRHRLRKSG